MWDEACVGVGVSLSQQRESVTATTTTTSTQYPSAFFFSHCVLRLGVSPWIGTGFI